MQRKVQVLVDGKVEVIQYTMAYLFQDICDGYLSIDSDLKRNARNAKAKEEDEKMRLAYERKMVNELTQQQLVGNPFATLSEEEDQHAEDDDDMFEEDATNLGTLYTINEGEEEVQRGDKRGL